MKSSLTRRTAERCRTGIDRPLHPTRFDSPEIVNIRGIGARRSDAETIERRGSPGNSVSFHSHRAALASSQLRNACGPSFANSDSMFAVHWTHSRASFAASGTRRGDRRVRPALASPCLRRNCFPLCHERRLAGRWLYIRLDGNLARWRTENNLSRKEQKRKEWVHCHFSVDDIAARRQPFWGRPGSCMSHHALM